MLSGDFKFMVEHKNRGLHKKSSVCLKYDHVESSKLKIQAIHGSNLTLIHKFESSPCLLILLIQQLVILLVEHKLILIRRQRQQNLGQHQKCYINRY